MTRAKLKLVDDDPRPIDITALIRADIEARDWGRVHVEADRRDPVELVFRGSRWR